MITIIKGHFICTEKPSEFSVYPNHYLIAEDGIIEGLYDVLPEKYAGVPVHDYGDRMIMPGCVDLHVHAPQYSYRGLGMDMELLEWLETNTFPEESKMKDINYAKKSYSIFVENLRKSATTRACIFATVHREATLLLMDMLENAGLCTMTGKVNMDRNCPDYIREASADVSAKETIQWVEDVLNRHYKNTYPILTPRFTPSCTDELMTKLKEIQTKYDLPLQSHLSENPGEIEWVRELCPTSEYYGDAYAMFGLFGNDCKTVMAHCVYSDEREIRRMKDNGVFIAHCPESNMNISSGIAPVRTYLEEGMHVGLGSDVAGGATENMFTAMAHAIQASKLRWRLADQSLKPLTAPEAFYMATKGGGAFFGKVGSFEPGYELDAVVLDDSRLKHPQELTLDKRFERLIYMADDREIHAKYVRGSQLF
jgi:guanine deaminase